MRGHLVDRALARGPVARSGVAPAAELGRKALEVDAPITEWPDLPGTNDADEPAALRETSHGLSRLAEIGEDDTRPGLSPRGGQVRGDRTAARVSLGTGDEHAQGHLLTAPKGDAPGEPTVVVRPFAIGSGAEKRPRGAARHRSAVHRAEDGGRAKASEILFAPRRPAKRFNDYGDGECDKGPRERTELHEELELVAGLSSPPWLVPRS